MIGSSLRYCGHAKCLNSILCLHNNSLPVLQAVPLYKQCIQARCYAKGEDSGGSDCKGCCREIDQKRGKRVEPWPKDYVKPPGCWKPDCPMDPPPPNYDVYRIKVPDVVVPPLPPSNAKRSGAVLAQKNPFAPDQQGLGGGCNQQPYGQGQQQQYDEQGNPIPMDDPDGGLIGLIKSFFGRGKKKDDDPYRMAVAPLERREAAPLGPWCAPAAGQGADARQGYRRERQALLAAPPPRLSYHGMTKYKMAFHEPWNPIDRLTLLSEAESEAADAKEAKEAGAVKTLEKAAAAK